MKVAIVYDCIPHYRAAVMRELLGSTKHDFHLIADEHTLYPTLKAWPIENRARFSPAPCRPLFGPLWFQAGVIDLAFRREFKAVIFMAYPNFISTWISALLCRLVGKRVFFWTHGWNRIESGPKAWLRIAFYKLTSGLLLYGHMAKSLGLQHGLAPDTMHVIYNSLDYEFQKRLRAELKEEQVNTLLPGVFENPDLPLVVCSARVIPSCQFELLLEAQHMLRSIGHHFNVLLIGDGPARASLEELARHKCLPVHFYGACYDEQILARLIRAANVTVSPGKVGLTAMHSLAYGTPVVTHSDWESQGPEWEAIVPGVTGQFFQRGNIEELAKAIQKWTSSPPSPATRLACYSILERFYNSRFQRRAIERALEGKPADDLFWIREESELNANHETQESLGFLISRTETYRKPEPMSAP